MSKRLSHMPRELALLREPVGRLLVGAIWLMVPAVAALARGITPDWGRIAGLSLVLAGTASITWWWAGPERLARLIMALALAAQVSLLIMVGQGAFPEVDIDLLPLAALTALVAYGDRGAVTVAGILLTLAHATAVPAPGMPVFVITMALLVAALAWLAGRFRGLALQAAHARHAAQAVRLTVVSSPAFRNASGERLELVLPALAQPSSGLRHPWKIAPEGYGPTRPRMISPGTYARH